MYVLKIEPMGSTAPNIPLNSRLQAIDTESGRSVNLVAMAQANPIPKFRLAHLINPVSQQTSFAKWHRQSNYLLGF
jgi:hypothetical protein